MHSTNGDNTFPIWVEEGTTIQPNSPIKSISIKEFNVVPNSNGNDLVFNKTVLVYSDSVSTVPEGKTWKLESSQYGLQLGDEYAGGIVFYLDGNGGGKVFTRGEALVYLNYSDGIDYCNQLDYNGYNDWYTPSRFDLQNIWRLNLRLNLGIAPGNIWASENAWYINMNNGNVDGYNANSQLRIMPIRQF